MKRKQKQKDKKKYSRTNEVVFRPLQVELREDESQDRLIRRFLKLVKNDGILEEHKLSLVFVKPSVERRTKRLLHARNAKLSNISCEDE